jgi:hypothetical protein
MSGASSKEWVVGIDLNRATPVPPACHRFCLITLRLASKSAAPALPPRYLVVWMIALLTLAYVPTHLALRKWFGNRNAR